MNKRNFVSILVSMALLAFTACSPVMAEMDGEQDGMAADGSSVDAGSSADTGPSSDKCPAGWSLYDELEPVVCYKQYDKQKPCPDGWKILTEALDLDGNIYCIETVDNSKDADDDGYTAKVDCNDSDAAVHPGATEKCGDKVDNNCNGQVDEGCATGNQGVDSDGDGYKTGPEDCNDNDASVHPGATEKCGDQVDNDCDGVVDEGCNTQTGSGNSLTIKYPTSFSRILNVQVTTNKASIGVAWDSGSPTSTGTTVTKGLGEIPTTGCVYVRWNVFDSDPSMPYNTACVGNGSTAAMTPTAVPTLVLSGKTYTKSDLYTWSAPGGTNSGCSGLFIQGGSSCSL